MNLSPNLEKIEKILAMPDVAKDSLSKAFGTLDKVGMEAIELPVTVENEGRIVQMPAKADVFVNLIDPKAKGIHMSRLYIGLQNKLEHTVLNPRNLKELLEDFVESHQGISNAAFLKITYDHMCKRPSLMSANKGWRTYPVTYIASHIDGQFQLELETRVVYSSTCPCSAALARQIIQNHFADSFSDKENFTRDEVYQWLGKSDSIIATPHSQRSHATVKVKLSNDIKQVDIIDLIDLIEKSLQTAVQAAVKREDEQEFARLNGSNPLFCEDAARTVRAVLEEFKEFDDYYLKVQHFESLHPHDAVAVVTKNIEGGYTA